MRKRHREFSDLPPGVKFAILFYMFSWFFFIASRMISTGTVSVLHLSMAMFLSLLVFTQRNWGRIVAALYCIGMAVMIGVEIYSIDPESGQSPLFIMLNGLSGLVFMASSAVLLFGESKRFYREHGI